MSSDNEKEEDDLVAKNRDLSDLQPVYPDAKRVEDLTESEVSSDEN